MIYSSENVIARLYNGYYLFYYKVSHLKFIYIFEMRDDDIFLLRMITGDGSKKYTVTSSTGNSDRAINRNSLTRSRTGNIFKLTDGEFLLETIEDI